MTDRLTTLREQGILTALDEQVARALARLGKETRDDVVLTVALASRATRRGHVCTQLDKLAAQAGLEESVDLPTAAALRKSALVGGAEGVTPLVLDEHQNLYLRRYFAHEERLAAMLRERAGHVEKGIDEKLLKKGLARLFPDEPDLQRTAALAAVMRRLCVISGGPGTGKTSTVVKILALLVEQALGAGRRGLHVLLVAPTGKAAARLSESIKLSKGTLACDEKIRALIPEDASTIHRALKPMGGRLTNFRHNQENPIPVDVLIVDEASMVDLALMTRLVAALPPTARLILLGDRNQLASVETGAILGDICGPQRANAGGAATKPGIENCIVQLTHSWRYPSESGIADLARAIHDGDSTRTRAVLAAGKSDVVLRGTVAKGAEDELRKHVVEGYKGYLSAPDPTAAFQRINDLRVLCAHRRGPFGVESLNERIEGWLEEEGLIKVSSHWYAGRPVLVTENDYNVNLFNGDVGLVLEDQGELRAYFLGTDGKLRALVPSRLPPHETVFAMTIHKAQGSEFDEVAVVLPDEASALLTRELLYTAVTRPKKKVVVYGTAEMVAEAVDRPIERASGLTAKLWGRG